MSDKNIPYISVVSKTDAPNRKILMQLGGKAQVPFLVNLTTADTLYESNDIIQYLEKHTK
jgi:glutathione S-transferase